MKSDLSIAAGRGLAFIFCISAACLTVQRARGNDMPSYMLAVPRAPVLRNTTEPTQNGWLNANSVLPLAASFAPAGDSNMVSSATIAGLPAYSVAASEAGFSIERTKPQFWLGDLITPPDGVNWTATWELFKTNTASNAAFVFDPQGERLFAALGGSRAFKWVLGNGTILEQTYVISSNVKGRPFRLYWTDHPYDGPAINLSGKFVKFSGDPSIVNVEYGTKTNYVSGLTQVISNTVVRGVYLDPDTKLLSAYGDIRGQFLLLYYDSGSFETLKHVQVVEVGPPYVVEMTGTIGERLMPSGAGYEVSGLTASPRAEAATDNRGEYYYQHKGSFSYSPKNGDVFPLRPTVGESWRMPVYWMEYDSFGTSWPFELCHYSCNWGPNTRVLVAGGKVIVPEGYTPTLMSYQEPEGHAKNPENNEFSTSGSGYSLLKINDVDNVWFVPFHSVSRTDKDYFTLEPEEWLVGSEITPRGGSVSGTAAGYSPIIDTSVAGYINKVESGDNYNHELYIDPSSMSQTNLVESVSSGDTNTYESVIYAVTTNAKPLEVWWCNSVLDEGMTSPLTYPTLVQRYDIKWPKVSEVPQIVIASQQGSAGECVYEMGAALFFDEADASLEIDDRFFFLPNNGAVSFWVRDEEVARGTNAVLTLGAFGKGLDVDVVSTESGDIYRLIIRDDSGERAISLDTKPISSRNEWHHITFSFDENSICAYVDGNVSTIMENVSVPDLSGWLVGNAVGAVNGRTAAKGCALDDIAVWCKSLDRARVADFRYELLSGATPNLTCLFSFTEDDLLPVSGSNKRLAVELVHDETVTAVNVLQLFPGSPGKAATIVDADTEPVIYRQNDHSLPAYNPNEEHALVTAGSGGYVVWALRCDLNTPDSSEPGVLIEYTKGGKKFMRYFAVVPTNEVYSSFADGATVGTVLPGPQPLTGFDDPWLSQTYWDSKPNSPVVAFRDRKKQVWSRCAGELPIHMYYPNQEGFDYPSVPANEQPKIGDAIPWLSSLGRTPDASVNSLKPIVWTWNVIWPKNIETMRIGQTLTKASVGLPEVWNASSVAIVYPVDTNKTVMLYDPTVIQHSGTNIEKFATVPILVSKCGFTTGDSGNVSMRAGKYSIKNLPPSISSRFYIDTTLDVSECLCLKGELESKTGGGSVLYVNVLNEEERDALRAAVPADNPCKRIWDGMIDRLALSTIEPSRASWKKNSDDKTNILSIDYVPRDHYALTAMGATNYVVIIENDATNKLMDVDEGDPISMHVFSVTNLYYTGDVYAREDSENLLSQQLSILYAESFGGKAGDFVFEWKKASPSANGTIPTDYENVFKRKFDLSDSIGLTRFILGGQGDTLADLVNTYYVCRYKAKDSTVPSYAVMGDSWSDWCGPTLAEGWVQRVLNSITPFSQRMTDLYENKAEMTGTAIQSAGAPYDGDVALSQDNMTSVGLIQLYQTVMNKAESLSLTLGVNNTDANKQLLLAAERLADLYVVLGNEAYSDAMNPTIGFGSTYGANAAGISSIDYGAESSSLFCFDNQVSSLLEEELALLRGRTGENAPIVKTAPYYNRLVWNFTKGITAGEVAYAVNYNVNSSNADATIDEEDAAAQYPQGHGDAYGHYLSALSSFYRLLRNPYFTWTVGMGEMLVNDAVVNEDYYDERRFAEIATKLSQTSCDIVDRTARQVWRDNGGVPGAGYLDKNASRNFGYGEWGTRGGIGSMMNWMVANSIIPESEDASKYYRLYFDGNGCASLDRAPCGPAESSTGNWTFECQVAADAEPEFSGDILEWQTDNALLKVSVDAGDWNVSASELSTVYVPVTNMVASVITNGIGSVSNILVESVAFVSVTDTNNVGYSNLGALPSRMILSISHTSTGGLSLRALDLDGVELAGTDDLGNLDISEGRIVLGRGFHGYISEMRFWDSLRKNDELASAADYVNPRSGGLISSVRGVSKRITDTVLAEESGADCVWSLENPYWNSVAESGFDVAFIDDGLLRIDRASVTDLRSLALSVPEMQRKLDKLDSGLNPIGLSESAIPFDITPLGVSDGSHSHFEQIFERAKIALKNAGNVLERAQSLGSRLRMIQNAVSDEIELASADELGYTRQLIELFGYPYSSDIGPSGTYVQGYDGPDLIHYMWMDLSAFGLTSADDITAKTVVKYNVPTWALNSFLLNYVTETSSHELSYSFSANGLIVKPDSITGTRLATGKLQSAYADYINAYVELSNAIDWYDRKTSLLTEEKIAAEIKLLVSQGKFVLLEALNQVKFFSSRAALASKLALIQVNASMSLLQNTTRAADMCAPSIVGAGLTVNTDPSAIINGAVNSATTPLMVADIFAKASLETFITGEENSTIGPMIMSALTTIANFTSEKTATRDRLMSYVEAQYSAASAVQSAWAKMLSASDAIDSLVAEGGRILSARESVRAKRVNRLTKLRYNDMYFRTVQNQALSRYSSAFDLAQEYVFLAAQAYDYETGLLSADAESGDSFRAEIIGARSLGCIDDDGNPLLGDGIGDAGLSDILARLDQNWLVLKPRLGINNPENNATWFSLRSELFRIADGPTGDADWRKALELHRVDDLRTFPEYTRYCQPFSSSSGLNQKEPGFVIEFSTDIDFAKNFFGKNLSAGDSAFDSTYYATKIAGAGIRFSGYNEKVNGYTGNAAALSATPVVYLFPAGADRMRVPGSGENGKIVDFNVVDQVVPVPYGIGSSELDDPDWIPLYTGYTGNVDPMARIRRYPSFRALTGDATDSGLASTRLIGRSVWNTRWILIIPAGQLLGGTAEDRASALDAFISGRDLDRDGITDIGGVTDVQFGLKTYSNSGN